MPIFPLAPPAVSVDPEDAILTYQPNHAGVALSRLISQFRGKPRIEAFLNALSRQAQALEDSAWTLLLNRLLSPTTVGVQLDNLGRIVGQPRQAMTDDRYRLMLAVRILINRSEGTGDDVLTVVQKIFTGIGALATIEMVERAFAEFAIVVHGILPIDPSFLTAIIKAAKSGGVRASLEFSYVDAAHTFTFGRTGGPATDAGTGWGDSLNPAVGGKFASVLLV